MTKPLLLWFRRDLRLSDHPMLTAAVETGRPLLPVFILDPETEALGAAAKLRLQMSLATFSDSLAARGSRLTLRRGPALAVLRDLARETGAEGVMWSRLYDPAAMARDKAVKAGLKDAGLPAQSHPGHFLHEPWTVETGQGGPFRVYTPFSKAVWSRPVPPATRAPTTLPAPAARPLSDTLSDWPLSAAMRRGGPVVAAYQTPGEAAAQDRLARFLSGPIATYKARRDDLGATDATSNLSDALSLGEIGVRQVWHAGWRAMEGGAAGAEHFLKEVLWREFAGHLLYHFPHMDRQNWKDGWDSFPWRGDNSEAEAWRRGQTGEPLVDAAMREMYVTGRMHNRARMVAASYLTKHLLTHWRVGLDWFADCLTDWDPASNAMGWQWVAGSGPDAAPYFRIFNPATQGETHDPDGLYRRRWLAEGQARPPQTALDYFRATPLAWALDPLAPPAAPLIDLSEGRARALAALTQGKS